MKNEIIRQIEQEMLPYLSNEQMERLIAILEHTLYDKDVISQNATGIDEPDLLEGFLNAKRIEGCSEKTLQYYRDTIQAMLDSIGKSARQILTEDLRRYLTEYQSNRKVGKVTIDNIRRIISSFFSWLEDEDYILKSPVRRIHKIKTNSNIKETYTDEELELMRDNCDNARDLAIIDFLSSTAVRVGELVKINISDIDFNERECVVFGRATPFRMFIKIINNGDIERYI